MAEVTRVRVELQEQNGRLQAELAAQEALKEKAAALERQLRGERPAAPPRGPAGPGLAGHRSGRGWVEVWARRGAAGTGANPARPPCGPRSG